jgi:hypothetical protein
MSCEGAAAGGSGNAGVVGEVTVLLWALLVRLASLKLGRLVELAADGRRRRSHRLMVGCALVCAWLLASSELEAELCERLGLCFVPIAGCASTDSTVLGMKCQVGDQARMIWSIPSARVEDALNAGVPGVVRSAMSR